GSRADVVAGPGADFASGRSRRVTAMVDTIDVARKFRRFQFGWFPFDMRTSPVCTSGKPSRAAVLKRSMERGVPEKEEAGAGWKAWGSPLKRSPERSVPPVQPAHARGRSQQVMTGIEQTAEALRAQSFAFAKRRVLS